MGAPMDTAQRSCGAPSSTDGGRSRLPLDGLHASPQGRPQGRRVCLDPERRERGLYAVPGSACALGVVVMDPKPRPPGRGVPHEGARPVTDGQPFAVRTKV
jgi:hypothetical protein